MAETGTGTATVAAPKARASKAKAAARANEAKAFTQAAILLKQAADGTRLRILTMLADGERHVGGLCETMGQSQPAVSHHLALLRHSGLIQPRRSGKQNFYSLTSKGEHLVAGIKGVVGSW